MASNSGDWARAADLWNRIRVETRDEAVVPHLATAEALDRLGQGEQALTLLERAAELFPADHRVALSHGQLLERQGFRRAAEMHLERAVELAPDSCEAHLALGRVKVALDQGAAGLRCLARARDLGHDQSELHRLLARASRGQGDLIQAHGAYQRALELEQLEQGEPSVELLVEAASLHTIRRGDVSACPLLEEALAWARLASERDPQCARCSFVLGGLLEQRGDHDEAIAHYRRAVEIDNLHLGALTNLALLHSNRGERDAAREMVQRAVDLESDERRRRALLALVQ